MSDMCVTQQEFQKLMERLDRTLSMFDGRPTEPGFDLDVYEELCRVRETLIRARRDMNYRNVLRDSRAPM